MDGCIMKRLLIIKLSALGDVVMTLPALKALKATWPEAEIDWLVEPSSKNLLEAHPDINRLLVTPRPIAGKLLKNFHPFKALNLWRYFFRSLRDRQYDAVLDFQGLFKSALNVKVARSPRKIGFANGREFSSLVLTEKLPPYDPERHALLRYLDLAAHLGANPPEGWETKPYYEPGPEARQKAKALLGSMYDSPFIALSPGTRWLTKTWPLAAWEGLAGLLSEAKHKLVVVGGPLERECGELLAQKGALSLVGKTSLKVLGAVLAQAKMLITPDSGPMHLAAAVGTGGLALFGPTRISRTGPFGNLFKILTPELDCLGCLKRQCPKNRSPQDCLGQISSQTVAQKTESFF
jgi:heptosyltransferase-1